MIIVMLMALVVRGGPMDQPERSQTSHESLVQSLKDSQERDGTLLWVKDYPGDARLVLPLLIDLLCGLDKDEETDSEYLSQALGAAGEPALPHLREAMRHDSARVRRCAVLAVRSMARYYHQAVTNAANEGVNDPALREYFEQAQARLLGAKRNLMAASQAVPDLIQRLDDPDGDVQLAAVEALADIGPHAAAAVTALADVLQKPGWSRRAGAAYALGHLGPAAGSAVPALAATVEVASREAGDVQDFTRHLCLHALAGVGPGAKAAVPTLLAVLGEPDPADPDVSAGFFKSPAATALGAIGHKSREVLSALEGVLSHNDPQVRLDGAWSLWQLDPGNQKPLDATLGVLRTALRAGGDEEGHWENIRLNAAIQLGGFGPRAKGAAADLKKASQDDPSEDVRSAARDALAKVLELANPD